MKLETFVFVMPCSTKAVVIHVYAFTVFIKLLKPRKYFSSILFTDSYVCALNRKHGVLKNLQSIWQFFKHTIVYTPFLVPLNWFQFAKLALGQTQWFIMKLFNRTYRNPILAWFTLMNKWSRVDNFAFTKYVYCLMLARLLVTWF